MSDRTNRREFLERASAGFVAATAATGVWGSTGGASDKLVVALIGRGGRGNRALYDRNSLVAKFC